MVVHIFSFLDNKQKLCLKFAKIFMIRAVDNEQKIQNDRPRNKPKQPWFSMTVIANTVADFNFLFYFL